MRRAPLYVSSHVTRAPPTHTRTHTHTRHRPQPRHGSPRPTHTAPLQRVDHSDVPEAPSRLKIRELRIHLRAATHTHTHTHTHTTAGPLHHDTVATGPLSQRHCSTSTSTTLPEAHYDSRFASRALTCAQLLEHTHTHTDSRLAPSTAPITTSHPHETGSRAAQSHLSLTHSQLHRHGLHPQHPGRAITTHSSPPRVSHRPSRALHAHAVRARVRPCCLTRSCRCAHTRRGCSGLPPSSR